VTLFVLEAQNINAGYNDAIIVRDVTVKAKEGEIVTIVGPNGSGKSTLIKSLFGLARLFSGKIFYREKEITKATPWEAVDLGLGYVPQFNNVFINLTVAENLEMGAYLQGNRKIIKQDKEMIYQMFPELYARRKALAENLSGGERQMLAIARAMMAHPKTLLLDEPLAFLSPKVANLVLTRLLDIKNQGTAIVLVEQNTRKALNLADFGYLLVEGSCIWSGEADQLLADEEMNYKFLGLNQGGDYGEKAYN